MKKIFDYEETRMLPGDLASSVYLRGASFSHPYPTSTLCNQSSAIGASRNPQNCFMMEYYAPYDGEIRLGSDGN